MAQKTAARGRPKGTGVDDAARLAAMAALIAANPGMKPTTAIKALGITNASVIRRLRDKYQHQPEHRVAVAPRPAATDGARQDRRHDVLTLRTQTSAVLRAPLVRPAARDPQTPPPRTPAPCETKTDEHPAAVTGAPRQDLFAAAFAAGVSAAQAVIHLQFKTMSYALQGSPVACFLRSQEVLRLMTARLAETAAKTG